MPACFLGESEAMYHFGWSAAKIPCTMAPLAGFKCPVTKAMSMTLEAVLPIAICSAMIRIHATFLLRCCDAIQTGITSSKGWLSDCRTSHARKQHSSEPVRNIRIARETGATRLSRSSTSMLSIGPNRLKKADSFTLVRWRRSLPS